MEKAGEMLYRLKENSKWLRLISRWWAGVMGQNLALNMESKGYRVVGYDYLPEKTDKFISERAGKNITGVHSLEELVAALATPRKIMMMVPAGKAVDELIEQLTPLSREGRRYNRRRKLSFPGLPSAGQSRWRTRACFT